jgi:hypothetical protein
MDKTVMPTRYLRTLALAALVSCGPVHANAVAEWNLIAIQVAMSEEQASVQPGHAVTMVHVAMFEVLNFIERRFASPYLVHPHPHKKQLLDETLDASLARTPASTETRAAEIQGRALAMNLYALRDLILGEHTKPLNAQSHGVLSWNPSPAR